MDLTKTTCQKGIPMQHLELGGWSLHPTDAAAATEHTECPVQTERAEAMFTKRGEPISHVPPYTKHADALNVSSEMLRNTSKVVGTNTRQGDVHTEPSTAPGQCEKDTPSPHGSAGETTRPVTLACTQLHSQDKLPETGEN